MNWDQIEGKWKQFTARARALGKLTDSDWGVIAGKKEPVGRRIQERYGVAKEEAEKQVDDWSRTHTATELPVRPHRTHLAPSTASPHTVNRNRFLKRHPRLSHLWMVEVVWRLPLIRLAAVVVAAGNRSLYSPAPVSFFSREQVSARLTKFSQRLNLQSNYGGGQPALPSRYYRSAHFRSAHFRTPTFPAFVGNKCMSQEISGQKMRREISSLAVGVRESS